MRQSVWKLLLSLSGLFYFSSLYALPEGFVYLKAIDPTIKQEIRYASSHNFVGRPIQGYHQKECILTYPTAHALHKIQKKLRPLGLSLKVYDCYRPEEAVLDFYRWSQNPAAQEMKSEFYPRINKNNLFHLGYIALQSSHSRGSTVDITITQSSFKSIDPRHEFKFRNDNLDMGGNYDLLDPVSNITHHDLTTSAYFNRLFLRKIMKHYGFKPYNKEWWHFTLRNEPFPNRAFNFSVE